MSYGPDCEANLRRRLAPPPQPLRAAAFVNGRRCQRKFKRACGPYFPSYEASVPTCAFSHCRTAYGDGGALAVGRFFARLEFTLRSHLLEGHEMRWRGDDERARQLEEYDGAFLCRGAGRQHQRP